MTWRNDGIRVHRTSLRARKRAKQRASCTAATENGYRDVATGQEADAAAGFLYGSNVTPALRTSPRARKRAAYLIRSKILKIGMYNATIIEPTMPPRKAIISGSIRAVSDSVVDSTSWS